jgi:hypothetical protein
MTALRHFRRPEVERVERPSSQAGDSGIAEMFWKVVSISSVFSIQALGTPKGRELTMLMVLMLTMIGLNVS